MESSDPWADTSTTATPAVVSRDNDSWADFAAFGSDSFSSFPGVTGAPPNTCVATNLSSTESNSQPPITASSKAADVLQPASNELSGQDMVQGVEGQQEDTPLADAPITKDDVAEGNRTTVHSDSNTANTGLDASAEPTS